MENLQSNNQIAENPECISKNNLYQRLLHQWNNRLWSEFSSTLEDSEFDKDIHIIIDTTQNTVVFSEEWKKILDQISSYILFLQAVDSYQALDITTRNIYKQESQKQKLEKSKKDLLLSRKEVSIENIDILLWVMHKNTQTWQRFFDIFIDLKTTKSLNPDMAEDIYYSHANFNKSTDSTQPLDNKVENYKNNIGNKVILLLTATGLLVGWIKYLWKNQWKDQGDMKTKMAFVQEPRIDISIEEKTRILEARKETISRLWRWPLWVKDSLIAREYNVDRNFKRLLEDNLRFTWCSSIKINFTTEWLQYYCKFNSENAYEYILEYHDLWDFLEYYIRHKMSYKDTYNWVRQNRGYKQHDIVNNDIYFNQIATDLYMEEWIYITIEYFDRITHLEIFCKTNDGRTFEINLPHPDRPELFHSSQMMK